MQLSTVQKRGSVVFPAFTGERVYMREFNRKDGLPPDLARWQPTVDAMLDGIEAPRRIFLMVDQAEVSASSMHRRGGVHVDGYWQAEMGDHGHRIFLTPRGVQPETLLLASDVLGWYVGEFEGHPAAGGDCSKLDISGLERVEMAPGFVWAGCATGLLHESIAVRQTCRRTVVRLNVQGL